MSTLKLNSDFFNNISSVINTARNMAYKTINYAMVQAYWNIGRLIVEEEQAGKERSYYGDFLIKTLSEKLTFEYGKGFTITNLKYMRQFYLLFPISHSLRDRTSSLRKSKEDNPTIGIILCSEKNETVVKYSVLKEYMQLFAAKYMLYLSTEEELQREIQKEVELIQIERKLKNK
ncbi:MAG: putative cytoplasmic protein [Ignavibacteria bacterium]|nr:putative cytoplasmic protein [Ignavibacteria bacterium]